MEERHAKAREALRGALGEAITHSYIDDPDLIVKTPREAVGRDKATFYAEVDKVQTMADGGIRVVLGLGEDGLKVMQFLARCKQQGIILDIVATARDS